MMQISQIEVGEPVTLFVLLKDVQSRTARNGNPYLNITFSDQTGEISGNLWDVTPIQIDEFQPGRVVYLQGLGDQYQGQAQVNIQGLRLATNDEPADPNLYVQRVDLTDQELREALRPFFAAIKVDEFRIIVTDLMNHYGDQFFQYPAAKVNHHALVGGLAFHTLSILRLAQAVAEQYSGINRSLLYAGAMLHDLGKVIGLSGPVATQYTIAGSLLGHISIVDGEIVQACQRKYLDAESEPVILLRHVILAHHGLLEYGSPVRPQLIEAEILHRLDELDASIVEINQALKNVEIDDYSERVFSLENRRFFKDELQRDFKDSE